MEECYEKLLKDIFPQTGYYSSAPYGHGIEFVKINVPYNCCDNAWLVAYVINQVRNGKKNYGEDFSLRNYGITMQELRDWLLIGEFGEYIKQYQEKIIERQINSCIKEKQEYLASFNSETRYVNKLHNFVFETLSEKLNMKQEILEDLLSQREEKDLANAKQYLDSLGNQAL